MKKKLKNLQRNWGDLVDLGYAWIAFLLMWAAILSNFTHIHWYVDGFAILKDWTSWAVAIVIEAGIGLFIYGFWRSLRTITLSTGQTTAQNKRFSWYMLGTFAVSSVLLAIFSGLCNFFFYSQNWILGIAAPSLTLAFGSLDGATRLLQDKTKALGLQPKGEPKPTKTTTKPPKILPKKERLEKIYRALCKDLNQDVDKLAKRFHVTRQTIYNDYRALAKVGKIEYGHGKVRALPQSVKGLDRTDF